MAVAKNEKGSPESHFPQPPQEGRWEEGHAGLLAEEGEVSDSSEAEAADLYSADGDWKVTLAMLGSSLVFLKLEFFGSCQISFVAEGQL